MANFGVNGQDCLYEVLCIRNAKLLAVLIVLGSLFYHGLLHTQYGKILDITSLSCNYYIPCAYCMYNYIYNFLVLNLFQHLHCVLYLYMLAVSKSCQRLLSVIFQLVVALIA